MIEGIDVNLILGAMANDFAELRSEILAIEPEGMINGDRILIALNFMREMDKLQREEIKAGIEPNEESINKVLEKYNLGQLFVYLGLLIESVDFLAQHVLAGYFQSKTVEQQLEAVAEGNSGSSGH